MKNLDFDKYYEAPEPGRRERAYGWATAIGLQDVDGGEQRIYTDMMTY